MSKTNTTPDISFESLNNAVSHFYRDETLNLLKNGAISKLDEDEKNSILKNILLLRDKKIIGQLAKDNCTFPPEMFDIDLTNSSNKEMVDFVFSKYRKSLDLSNADNCDRFFELACKAESVSLLTYMISNSMAVDSYKMLAAGPTGLINLATKIKKNDLTDSLVAELYVEAALSNSYRENIDALIKKGFKITAANADGEDAIALASTEIANTIYSKNRAGEMKHRLNQNGLSYLRKATKNCLSPESGKKDWRPLIIALCVVVLGAACVFAIIYTNKAEDSSTETTTETTTSDTTETTDTTTDETTDTTSDTDSETAEAATTLSTDTSLVVADGDIVNIDYTGYIDGVAFDGGSTNGAGADLEIGSGTYIDDFEDQLVGHNVGDEVEVTVTFPDDYGNDDLNGKEATFDVTINGIYQ